VVIADSALTKPLFAASNEDLIGVQPSLNTWLGKGSLFGLEGDERRNRRKLLMPSLRGQSIKSFETIVEEETLRESQAWPQHREFRSLEPMERISLNVILRAVFGVGTYGAEIERLRKLFPPMMALGFRLIVLPRPPWTFGRYSPWGRLAQLHREFDALVNELIAKSLQDPDLDERTDILGVLLKSRYDDGSAMSHQEIADELLALVTAGHSTTAAALAWTFERISRHPDLLSALVAEAATDNNELRRATILETLRSRSVIDFVRRSVRAPMFELGPWRIPRGYAIMASISLIHADPESFPEPDRFDPTRFVGKRANTFRWIPYGGGNRRCIGDLFANLQMDVLLRTVLRNFTIEPTTKPAEEGHTHGVSHRPAKGGLIVVARR
jgi:cytochrome P450